MKIPKKSTRKFFIQNSAINNLFSFSKTQSQFIKLSSPACYYFPIYPLRNKILISEKFNKFSPKKSLKNTCPIPIKSIPKTPNSSLSSPKTQIYPRKSPKTALTRLTNPKIHDQKTHFAAYETKAPLVISMLSSKCFTCALNSAIQSFSCHSV